LPNFIEDDDRTDDSDSPLMRNFTLSLQSVICHRGTDLSSGHYVCFIRGTSQAADGDFHSARRLSTGSLPPEYPIERWFKHDDLAHRRVTRISNIVEALKEEMPYLLFYQVQPVFQASHHLEVEPPAYSDSGIDVKASGSSPSSEDRPRDYFDGATLTPRISVELPRRSINLPDDRQQILREVAAIITDPEKSERRVSLEERRGSVTFEQTITSAGSSVRIPDITSTPATPLEETTGQRLSRAASKFRSGSKSRPTSSSGENRISSTFSRLAQRSVERLNKEREQPPPLPT